MSPLGLKLLEGEFPIMAMARLVITRRPDNTADVELWIHDGMTVASRNMPLAEATRFYQDIFGQIKRRLGGPVGRGGEEPPVPG